jgi:hypothetical protein
VTLVLVRPSIDTRPTMCTCGLTAHSTSSFSQHTTTTSGSGDSVRTDAGDLGVDTGDRFVDVDEG